jgi:hypothetical protein
LAWLLGLVVWIAVGAIAGVIAVFAVLVIGFAIPSRRGLRRLAQVDAQMGSPGSAHAPWSEDPIRRRSYIVQQADPRFEAQARRLLGPWYLLQIVDKTTGQPLARAAKSVPLSGRSSANRAVKFGILRFYAEHPDQR